MLCEDCKRKVDNEFYGMIKPENKDEQQMEAIDHLKIGVMLSDQVEQARLVQELQRLCENAEILGFARKGKLLQAAKNDWFSIIFLSETYGVESGITIGKRIQTMAQNCCNLIYVTDSTDTATLAALWEMHISGIVPLKFTADEIETELRNLRYPVLDKALLW